jgi:outer membrane protein assembly factor BamA
VRVTRRVFPCLSGDLSADDVGGEIQSFLEEDLPGAELFTLPDPSAVSDLFGPTPGAGGRAKPVDLNPAMTYHQETYDRAIKHLRELYYSKGYLNAIVGPVSVLRATCSRRSPAGGCVPEPVKDRAGARCGKDEFDLPLPEPPVPESLTCRPDPARHVECSPEITLRIPIHLGPRTTLYDLAFEGNKGFCDKGGLLERDQQLCKRESPFSERWLAGVADLRVGEPLSGLELDAARLRLLDAYRNQGYAYAEVRTVIEPSPDRTRARARFVITERDRVTVTGFVIKGAVRTEEQLIRGRLALRVGSPYRQEQARLSEERIATLGTFSSVSIALEDPDVPQKNKRVVITVVEQLPQYLEPRVGFSTGEGFRFAVEYGHRNIAGLAIALTLRVELSYLPSFFILDEAVRRNYLALCKRNGEERKTFCGNWLERRNSASINFPEIGLGPLVSLSMEGLDVRDNQRDFGLTKQAFIPTVTFRPRRSLTTQLGTGVELNDVEIFNKDALNNTIGLLRAPEGRTIALAQRVNISWDARDNPFAATTGVLIAAGAEHVDAFPADAGGVATIQSHFIRFTGRVAGYIPLTREKKAAEKKTVVALSMSAGYNLQLTDDSQTYPDRLFFLGGVDSIRAFLVDSVVPEDVAQRIIKGSLNEATGERLTINDVVIRGGEVALNPRAELRFPLTSLLQGGIFLDTGNLWVDPSEIDLLALRYAAGAGLRIATPIGPLALDYGINLIRRPWEDFGAFHFSIGLF